MSPILEKPLDRVGRARPNLEETEEGSSGLDVFTEIVRGMDGSHTELQFQGDQVKDRGERPGRSQFDKEAVQSLNLENAIKTLVWTQIREASVPDVVHGQLVVLLQQCLGTDQIWSSIVALSGYIEHSKSWFEEELGWGCGWHNIQMITSYMPAQNPEVKDVLFVGAGFGLDIPAMQLWLEIAWLKGLMF